MLPDLASLAGGVGAVLNFPAPWRRSTESARAPTQKLHNFPRNSKCSVRCPAPRRGLDEAPQVTRIFAGGVQVDLLQAPQLSCAGAVRVQLDRHRCGGVVGSAVRAFAMLDLEHRVHDEHVAQALRVSAAAPPHNHSEVIRLEHQRLPCAFRAIALARSSVRRLSLWQADLVANPDKLIVDPCKGR